MAAKLCSSFLMLSHLRLKEGEQRDLDGRTVGGQDSSATRWSYLSLRLILVNSTRPASMGRVSSPAEIIRRQSS